MKTTRTTSLLASSVVLCGLFSTGGLAQTDSRRSCSVTIEAPKTGQKEGDSVLVTGTATMPAGQHLWVFAHRKGLAIWWPQGGGAATIERGGEYAVLATLGGPADVGADFEITAVVVDGAANQTLIGWVKQADQTGQYPGIQLPPAAPGCGVPPKATVSKVR